MIHRGRGKGKESNKTEPIPEPTCFNIENGDSVFLRNVGIRLQDYTVPYPTVLMFMYVTFFTVAFSFPFPNIPNACSTDQ